MEGNNAMARFVGLDGAGANESQFFVDVQGIPEHTFSVLSLECESHAIGADYAFSLRLTSESEIDPSAVVGAAARIEVRWEAQPIYVHGIVVDYDIEGHAVKGWQSRIVLRSPLTALDYNVQSRVFLNKDVKQVIEQVWSSANLPRESLDFSLRESYPAREFTVQYQESDLAFITRLMRHYGLFYIFEQSDKRAKVMVHDDVKDLPVMDGTGEVVYRPQGGEVRQVESVQSFVRRTRLLTDQVKVRDYNYRTPETVLDAVGRRGTHIKGSGSDYRYGDHYQTLDEGEALARVRQEALDWRRETFEAESDCRGMAPGHRFTLTGHPDKSLNGDYLVVSVRHTADQSVASAYGEAAQGPTYRNTLTLIRAGVPFRLAAADEPRVHGTITARVETTGGDYAYLDEQGRYHVRLMLDRSDAKAGEASQPVRLMQPYTGAQYGMHFPLHAGAEVALAFVNGDIDRPIMLGALPNPDTPSPVTSANPTQNVLRTWGGNELVMDDRKGQERVELFTRERKNILALDADSNGHKVRLASEEGEMALHAAKSMLIESGDSQTVQVGKDHKVVVENAQHLMTKNKEIGIDAATDLRMKAGDHIQLQAEKENIEMEAAEDVVVQAGHGMSVEVRNEDLTMFVSNGNIGIQAAKDITVKGQGGGTMHIGQSGASIEISSGGDLIISGSTVTISGSSINIKGSSIGNN